MRILNCLYYYRPHYSGLTVYTERLARTLAARGHQVTILTSRYDPALPAQEVMEGVHVRRVPVALRVSKGPVMPGFLAAGWRALREHDLLHLHVPQLDAAPLAWMARVQGKPVIMTYHCDLRLPSSPVNALANVVMGWANRLTLAGVDVVVANARDYAETSPLLSRGLRKLEVIPPPIEVRPVLSSARDALLARLGGSSRRPIIGMAARLATEKGAEVLAQAMPLILERHPEATVAYVGQYENVMGEEAYRARLEPLLSALKGRWCFLGVLPDSQMSAFYSLCDVTVLPSLNRTESFGMVQVESMLCGTPVVASDIDGVREPVRRTGMGLVVPPRQAHALAEAVLEILSRPEDFRRGQTLAEQEYSGTVTADRYEALFVRLCSEAAHVSRGRQSVLQVRK
jgi:glycosyltransferase involved in cell wall biosynthesis